MLEISIRPGSWSFGYSFFGHSTLTPRVRNAPPMRGQSAPMKTQDPMEGDIGVDSRLDDLDLLQLSVYQLGAVAGSDEELLCPCADDAAFDLELRTPLVLLRVDEPDACRCDGEVVDVRS
jgi:hypothetical protein